MTLDLDGGPPAVLARCRTGSRSSTRPGGSRCPTRSATRSPARCARRARTSAPCTRPACASRRSSSRPRRKAARVPRLRAARGDLRAEHDLAELHAVAHRGPRASQPATRSSSPRSTTTAASRRGSSSPTTATCVVQHVELRDDTTLDFDDLRVEAVGPRRAWSRSRGRRTRSARSSTPRACAELAHEVGALAWIDAVHYAAHEPIDVRAIDADVLICSPYKFCGPHLGIAYGRAEVLERGARTRRGRRRPTPLGRRFETGTLPYELLAGFNATIDYLRLDRRLRRDRPVRARARRAVPRRRSPDARDGLRAADDGGPRADVPGQRRGRAGRATSPPSSPSSGSASGRTTRWYSLDLYKRLGYDEHADPRSASSTTTRPTRSTGCVGELTASRRARPVGRASAPARARSRVEQLDEPAARLPQLRAAGAGRSACRAPAPACPACRWCPRRGCARRSRSGGSARPRSARPSRSAARPAGRGPRTRAPRW